MEITEVAKASKKAEEDIPEIKKSASAQPRLKKQQTVRERTQTGAKSRRLRSTASKVAGPLGKARQTGKREYHLPLPDNRAGRVLRKRVRIMPAFMRDAWQEIKQVTWPTAKDTMRLTLAVFIFAAVFAAIVGVLDFGLDKLFREVLLKK